MCWTALCRADTVWFSGSRLAKLCPKRHWVWSSQTLAQSNVGVTKLLSLIDCILKSSKLFPFNYAEQNHSPLFPLATLQGMCDVIQTQLRLPPLYQDPTQPTELSLVVSVKFIQRLVHIGKGKHGHRMFYASWKTGDWSRKELTQRRTSMKIKRKLGRKDYIGGRKRMNLSSLHSARSPPPCSVKAKRKRFRSFS